MNKLFFIIFLFMGSSLFALSNQAKIDILKIKLVEQQKKGNYAQIISSINEWKKIDNNIPISLVFWEGKAYYKTKDYIKSFNSLEYYIDVAGNSGRFYQEALKLYLEVEPKYKKAKRIEAKKEESKNRVVKDKATGLMWQDDYDVVSFRTTAYGAANYCKKLNLNAYSDWTLPTANQVMTIMDFSQTPAIKKEFKNVLYKYNYQFIKDGNSKYKYYFSNSSGHIVSTSISTKAYVRCVRKFK